MSRSDIPEMAGRMTGLRSIQLNLTNTCAQRCVMCRKYDWPARALTLGVVQSILDAIAEETTVILSGGEPLLHPEFDRVIQALESRGVAWALLTNGMRLNTAVGSARYLNISFDGPDRETYRRMRGIDAFDRVLNNIQGYRKLFPDMKIMLDVTVTKMNVHGIPGLLCLADRLGADIYFQHVHTFPDLLPSRAEALNACSGATRVLGDVAPRTNFFIFMEQILNGNLCSTACCAIDYHCVIDADGAVFPCCRALNDNGTYSGRNTRLKLGDVNEDPLPAIWTRSRQSQTLDCLRRKQEPFCAICDRYAMFNWFSERYWRSSSLFM